MLGRGLGKALVIFALPFLVCWFVIKFVLALADSLTTDIGVLGDGPCRDKQGLKGVFRAHN